MKDRYYDPQERATWLEEMLMVRGKDALFRLELECAADQAESLRFASAGASTVTRFRPAAFAA